MALPSRSKIDIMFSLLYLSVIFTFSSRAIAQDCYFPNGGLSGSDTACNPNSLVSACCFDGQACLSNGLCVSDPHNETLARLHRGTCTDKNWKSGNCPRHCLDINNNGVPVYSCNQTGVDSYCCFDNCACDSRWETFSFQDANVYTVTIIGEAFTQTRTSTPSAASSTSGGSVITTGASAATTAGPTSTGSASGSASGSAPSSAEENKSSNSTAIGIGVGVGIAGAALIGAAAFFFWRRKKRNGSPYGNGTSKTPFEAHGSELYPLPGAQKYAHYGEGNRGYIEMHGTSASSELPVASYDPVELPTNPLGPTKK